MKRFNLSVTIVFFASLLLTVAASIFPSGAVAAQPQPQDQPPAAQHAPLQNLLEQPSMLVVDIDVSKLDFDAMVAWTIQRAGVDEANRPPQGPIQMAGGFIESLKSAGVTHLYLSVPTRVLSDGGPLVVIPAVDVATVEGLAAVLISTTGADAVLKIRKRPGLVLVGPEKVLDRLDAADDDAPGDSRSDLLEPLRDSQRKDHLAVFSLADAYRQELVAIWPDSLPERAPLQLSPRELASDIQRITLSWNLPPELAIDATVQAVDAAAAERVEESLQTILAWLADLGGDANETETPRLPDLMRKDSRVQLSLSGAAIDTLIDQLKRLPRLGEEQKRSNNLKQIGLAMHNFYNSHQHLPPKYFIDRQGQPLASWRVAILPYIEQQALYQSLELDQPWDAAANSLVSSVVIPTYHDRGGDDHNKTRFRVPIFPGSAWEGEGPPKTFKDITDGVSNTIAVIHAPPEAAVPWASPSEWMISPEDPMKDVFGDRDSVTVLFFDGSVRTFQRDELDNEKLSALLTIAGGEMVTW